MILLELEKIAANKFGKEDALFVPSGIMRNMVNLLTHSNRRDLLVVSENTHLYRSEKGNFDNIV